MKTGKIGALFLVSVMALAATGGAYALWYDDVHLDITVYPGYIGAEWSVMRVGDSEEANKDVSGVTWTLGDWDTTDGIVNDWLWMYINNGYPCIDYWLVFDFHNTGTIPIHVAFDATGTTYNGFNELTGADGKGTIVIKWYYDDALTDPITGIPQVHPGETVYGYILVHFNNNLEQSTPDTYGIAYDWVFCGSFAYWQYNEDFP